MVIYGLGNPSIPSYLPPAYRSQTSDRIGKSLYPGMRPGEQQI